MKKNVYKYIGDFQRSDLLKAAEWAWINRVPLVWYESYSDRYFGNRLVCQNLKDGVPQNLHMIFRAVDRPLFRIRFGI